MPALLEKRPALSQNAITVLERRCLRKNAEGAVVESPDEMFERVAKAVAEVRPAGERRQVTERYHSLLRSLSFLPNSPTLMNAGTSLGQLAACFVLPVEDSLDSIFAAVQQMAMVHRSGGGTGFSFSRLRPAGDPVAGSGGVASGPVSFLRVFDVATQVVKQGGRRRGANMGVLRVDHPDILAFIDAKLSGDFAQNFNLSVATTDAFWEAVAANRSYDLINPRTKRKTGSLDANDVLDRITHSAWSCGDPGVLFIDEINRKNPVPALGEIEATNPCGEQPLLPYESCTLGSINVAALVQNGKLDWDALEEVTGLATEFLDDVIDANRYPLPEIREQTLRTRRIGVGVMGWADALLALGIPYASDEALGLAEKLMGKITRCARAHSARLAETRGAFPAWGQSIWKAQGTPMRNAAVTTVAPTGTLSIIAGVSSGIEPLFALAFVRRVLEETSLLEVNPLFREKARALGVASEEAFWEIARKGSIVGHARFPEDVQRLFQTALDIAPPWHVKMQAAFQKHTESAVSKTINLPESASEQDVRDAYLQAWRTGCKGITVFRYGSKGEQVLYIGERPAVETRGGVPHVHAEYAGECRVCSV